MKNRPTLPLLVGLLFLVSGCSAGNLSGPIGDTGFPPTPTPTRAGPSGIEASCALLTTRDLASLFPTHTETILPKPQINRATHPAFATSDVSGTETSCEYYSFYLPGSHAEIVLQVTYWLDMPASAATTWRQLWAAASAQGAQTTPRIGDGSFYANDQLSFRKGDLYVTVAATETDWDASSSADMDRQRAVEAQLARDMLSRLPYVERH